MVVLLKSLNSETLKLTTSIIFHSTIHSEVSILFNSALLKLLRFRSKTEIEICLLKYSLSQRLLITCIFPFREYICVFSQPIFMLFTDFKGVDNSANGNKLLCALKYLNCREVD